MAKWWASLDAADQALIQKAVDEAIAANRPVTEKLIAQAEVDLKKKGVSVVKLNDTQEKALQQATAGVWKQYEPEIGKDLIDELDRVRANK